MIVPTACSPYLLPTKHCWFETIICLFSVSRDIVCRRDGGERIIVKKTIFTAKIYREHPVFQPIRAQDNYQNNRINVIYRLTSWIG